MSISMLVCNNVIYKSTYHIESAYAIWNQEVSDCVIAFSGTKAIALKNYCIPKIT